MKSGLFFVLLALVASVSIPTNAGDYYKWVDSEGVTHFSETRPTDSPSSLLRIKASKPANPPQAKQVAAIEGKPALLDTTEEIVPAESQPQNQSKKPQLTEQQIRNQRHNCATAKNKLVALENAGRVRLMDQESGEYRYLPDRGKLAEIAKMRSYLRANCRGI